jgi:hypothetical protein
MSCNVVVLTVAPACFENMCRTEGLCQQSIILSAEVQNTPVAYVHARISNQSHDKDCT